VSRIVFLWIVVLTLSGLPGEAAASSARPEATVALVPIVPEWIPAQAIEAARGESVRIWAAYGVRVVWLDRKVDCERAPAPRVCLFVVFTRQMRSSLNDPRPFALGQVDFGPDGEPLSEIRIAYPTIVMLLDRWKPFGPEGPAVPRTDAVGRALGRVVAHELGHVLMGTQIHTERGLMRHTFRAKDLESISRRTFTLNSREVAAVRARLTARETDVALWPPPAPPLGASR
jgi:hypothetical protein